VLRLSGCKHGLPFLSIEDRASQSLTGRPPDSCCEVKKAPVTLERPALLKQVPHPSGWPHDGRCLGLVSVRFLRGNRPLHDPLRCACRVSRRDASDAVLSPASLRTGRKAVFVTRGARSDRGWGEVPAVSSHGGECRGSDSRPLTLRTFGGCPRLRGNFQSNEAAVSVAHPAAWDVPVVHSRAR
jgi:hypothetical protein